MAAMRTRTRPAEAGAHTLLRSRVLLALRFGLGTALQLVANQRLVLSSPESQPSVMCMPLPLPQPCRPVSCDATIDLPVPAWSTCIHCLGQLNSAYFVACRHPKQLPVCRLTNLCNSRAIGVPAMPAVV